MKSFVTLALLSTFVAGCSPREHTPSRQRTATDLSLITTNMTLQQVIDRVGMYDRVRGSGISYYEYAFAGGSAVLVCPDLSLAAKTNPSITITFYRSTNEIPLSP